MSYHFYKLKQKAIALTNELDDEGLSFVEILQEVGLSTGFGEKFVKDALELKRLAKRKEEERKRKGGEVGPPPDCTP